MIHVSSGPQIQYKCVNIYCDKLNDEILFYLSDPELRQVGGPKYKKKKSTKRLSKLDIIINYNL